MKDYEYNCIFLPYLLQELEDDIGGWVILNRKYKILGTISWTDYKSTPTCYRVTGITDETKRYLTSGFVDPSYSDKIYFFNGSCSPLDKNAFKRDREQYVSKLCMLSALKMIDGLDVYYLLLPAINRVNRWNTEWKIIGPGQTQKTPTVTLY
jgi:hypothetical protein